MVMYCLTKHLILPACLQALQYKTQASQAQLKAQQEADARKRIEAEARAVAAQARMSEKPRVCIVHCTIDLAKCLSFVDQCCQSL